jgi:hypothetical protein
MLDDKSPGCGPCGSITPSLSIMRLSSAAITINPDGTSIIEPPMMDTSHSKYTSSDHAACPPRVTLPYANLAAGDNQMRFLEFPSTTRLHGSIGRAYVTVESRQQSATHPISHQGPGGILRWFS